MKKLLILALILLIGVPVMAQSKEDKKAAKEAKKAQKEMEDAHLASILDTAIINQKIVLEADYLGNPSGERAVVEKTLNFIGVDEDAGAYMFGSGMDVGYTKALMTIDGTLSGYSAAKNEKRGSHIIKFRIATRTGLSITVQINSNEVGDATATIRENNEIILKMTGRLVPLSRSVSYKGRSAF